MGNEEEEEDEGKNTEEEEEGGVDGVGVKTGACSEDESDTRFVL